MKARNDNPDLSIISEAVKPAILERSGGTIKRDEAQSLRNEWVQFEGVHLPPMMRPNAVVSTFGIGRGALYSHLSTGRIKSIAVKGNPGQRRATRLIFTQSLIEFIESFKSGQEASK